MDVWQVPGLKKAEIAGDLEEAGIEKVYVVCANDGAVMSAWKKDQVSVPVCARVAVSLHRDEAAHPHSLTHALLHVAGPRGIGAHRVRRRHAGRAHRRTRPRHLAPWATLQARQPHEAVPPPQHCPPPPPLTSSDHTSRAPHLAGMI